MIEDNGKIITNIVSSETSMKDNMNAFNQQVNMFYEYSSLDMHLLAQ